MREATCHSLKNDTVKDKEHGELVRWLQNLLRGFGKSNDRRMFKKAHSGSRDGVFLYRGFVIRVAFLRRIFVYLLQIVEFDR